MLVNLPPCLTCQIHLTHHCYDDGSLPSNFSLESRRGKVFKSSIAGGFCVLFQAQYCLQSTDSLLDKCSIHKKVEVSSQKIVR